MTLVVVIVCVALPPMVYWISLQAERASASDHSRRAASARASLLQKALEKTRDSLVAFGIPRTGLGSLHIEEADGFAKGLLANNTALRGIGWVKRDDDSGFRIVHLRSRDEEEPFDLRLPQRTCSILEALEPGEAAVRIFPGRSADSFFAGSITVFALPAREVEDARSVWSTMCVVDLQELARNLSHQWGLWPMETHLFHAPPGGRLSWLLSIGVESGPATLGDILRDSPLGEVHVEGFDFCGSRFSVASAPQQMLLDEHMTWQPFGALFSSVLLVCLGFIYTRSLMLLNKRLQANMTDLIQSERKAAQFLEAAPEAMVVADSGRQICTLNHQAELLFGYSKSEMTGRCVCTLFRLPDDADRPCSLLTHLDNKPGPSETFPMDGFRRDGTVFPASVSVRTIDLGDGQMVLCAAIRDETEAKEAEESIALVAEQLAASNAELADFASVASHDLQEPLRQISSYLQLITERIGGELDPEVRQFMEYVLEGASRMSQLIDDLLEYSRIGCKRALPTGSADTSLVMEKVSANLRLMVEDNEAELLWHGLPVVKGDKSQLEQLFVNLISNALKYRSGNPPRIEVTARRFGEMWEFAVRDNGIGIDPRYHERIFQMFERLHGYGKYKGTGIGLATCRKIVENSGGRIWVESEEGQGTTFLFTLPATDERDNEIVTGTEGSQQA